MPDAAPQPEAQARRRIDALLEASGWTVQDRSAVALRAGAAVALRELPTRGGEADYGLFLGQELEGVVEAKKVGATLGGVEAQTLAYASETLPGLQVPIQPLPFRYESTGVETFFTNGLDPMATQNPRREGNSSPSVRRLEPTQERAEYVSHVLRTSFVDANPAKHLQLVGPDGVAEDIPVEIYAVLREVFQRLKDGQAISLIPDDALLTMQQAAEILNISRPYLCRLLDADEIPFVRVGTHRKLHLADVEALRERRRNESRKALNTIAALNEECDDYGCDYGETTRE